MSKKLFGLSIRILFLFFISSFFSPAINSFAIESSPSKIPNDSLFTVATVEKMVDLPVHWVAAGGGVLAYGSGQQVYFAPEENPYEAISSLSFDTAISEALILGRYAFLAQEGLGLRILDLQDPSNPIDLGLYPLSGASFRIANWGNLLFVGDGRGIQVLESSQGMLSQRGFISIAAPVVAMAADVGKLYVATEGDKVLLFDLSDPLSPVEAREFPVSLPVQSMAVNANRLFIAAGAAGLHVFDVSIPGSPEPLATHSISSESLYLAGRLVYLATGSDGLHLLQAGPITAATFNVSVNDNFFSPITTNVNTGDTVTWDWANAAGGHSTTSGPATCVPDGMWNSGIHTKPFSFSFTFNTAGTFPYFCIPHCSIGMTGSVTVTGPVINISVTPPSIDFGSVTVGQSSTDQTITIRNQASSTGTLTGTVGTLSLPFSVISGGGAFSLAPGASKSVVVRFSPTAAGPASTNLVISHNATNPVGPTNVPLSGTGVSAPPSMPDLVVSAISGPSTAIVGSKISISNTVANQGTATAKGPFLVNFYLSTDNQITTSDVLIGKRTIKSLAAGASDGPVTTQATIPKSVTPGSYFLGAIVDPTNKVSESDETNNTNFDSQGITLCSKLTGPSLLSPKNKATNVSTTPTLDWSDVSGATQYEVQVATDSGFSNIVASNNTLTTSQWLVSPDLGSGTTHFWRARGLTPCGSGPFSKTSSFKTM